jgi:RNA polymerase sigma-70 factor, ECF subfamily
MLRMSRPYGSLSQPPETATPLEDRALVARVRSGDAGAYEQLFRRYWDSLYNVAFRFMRAADDAEDIVQGVFSRIWQSHASWHVIGSLGGYLHSAVRNACLDRLRHDAVARQFRERKAAEIQREGAAVAPEVLTLLVAAEIDAAIESALADLPPGRRQIWMLRFSGLSYEEIAARLGIARKTVETQIARGLKQVRERIKEHRH